jgi:hypothetical protein
MTHTLEPLECPHCGASIKDFDDVLTLTRVSGGMIVIGCASCRKVLGVLPPEKS